MPRPRKVEVTFQAEAPWYTPAGDTIYLAGNFPAPYYWNPGNRPMTRVDETHWAITMMMDEGTRIEYKYTRGNWGKVEKNPDGSEMGNRQAVVAYGANGRMAISDTVARWADLRLVVASPAEDLVTTDSVVEVTGNVLPGEALSVNGQAVQPAAGGDFGTTVRLLPGLNTISVVAGTDANTITVTRKVTYQTRVELVVTPAGASVEIFDKKLKIEIPVGAVKADTSLVLEVIDENGPLHPENLKRLSRSYVVSAGVKKFRVPVTISIGFDAAALNGLGFEDLGIFTAKYDATEGTTGKEVWRPFEGIDDGPDGYEGSVVDLASGRLTIRTEHYGKLAVMARLEKPEDGD
ncbi:MAG: CBM20 domain-containing protein [Firmicutes bacterium]|nr:CBM20 domain-containing protein [Bacillota bacterium]